MHCKYCGAALPTKGGVCPNCGKMIPISQQKELKEMMDPRWNDYHNKDTGFYKSRSNNDSYASDAKIGKYVLIVGLAILIFVIILIVKK